MIQKACQYTMIRQSPDMTIENKIAKNNMMKIKHVKKKLTKREVTEKT